MNSSKSTGLILQFDSVDMVDRQLAVERKALEIARASGIAGARNAKLIIATISLLEQRRAELAPADPDKLDTTSFIMAAEDGTLTQEQFDASAQAFVDSGVWRHLQGSWQRTVCGWAEQGLVTIK